MNMFRFFYITLPTLAILHAMLSIMAKIILKKNGYQVTYLITQFFYESSILKKLCTNQKSIKSLLIIYSVVSYLLIVETILLIIWFILI